LRLAEILDSAGFAYLEVSGGGCFDAAVKRGVESPWERIRALRARTKTPLALALRGRFLVGSRPVGPDFVRRFVESSAESGIDVFRLHDPLNDVSNLREAAEAITRAEREFDAGLVYSPGPSGETDALVEQAQRLPELGAARVLVHDPSGALEPHRVRELIEAIRAESGLPVGLYCQGAGGSALAAGLEAARAGADLIAAAVYPVALVLHRASGEALADALQGLGLGTDIDIGALWAAADVVDEHISDQPVPPLAPRIATRAAQHSLPAGLVAALDLHLRAHAAGDRLDEVIEELERIRAEAGWPPLAAPIGQVLASQALLHVLGAERYQTVVDELRDLLAGHYGNPPGEIDPAVRRAVELVSGGAPAAPAAPDLEELRERYSGLAASEEELLLLALFGDEAEPLLRTIRGRGREESLEGGGVDATRAERIREIVRIVQESGVGEVTIEDAGLRVTVRRTRGRRRAPGRGAPGAAVVRRRAVQDRGADGRHLLPGAVARRAAVRRGGRRRRRRPDALHPRGDEADERGEGGPGGDRPADLPGQRAGGRVRRAAVRARAGQRPPATHLDVQARPGREPRRDRGPGDPDAARARDRGRRGLLHRRPRRSPRADGRPGRLHRPAA